MSHSLETPLEPSHSAPETGSGAAPLAADSAVRVSPHSSQHLLFGIPWQATWVMLLSLSAVLSSLLVMAVHGKKGFFVPVLAICVCALAALFDACTTRIPNQLTYPAILLGLLLNGIVPVLDRLHGHQVVVWLGAAGMGSSLLGFAACAVLGLTAVILAGVHGGDLKLLAAVGAMLGLLPTANVMIVALTCAIVYSLLNLAVFGRLNTVLRRAAYSALEVVYFRRLQMPLPEAETSISHIPMAIPLALGLIVAEYWQFSNGGLVG